MCEACTGLDRTQVLANKLGDTAMWAIRLGTARHAFEGLLDRLELFRLRLEAE
jgi:hypothetical protein